MEGWEAQEKEPEPFRFLSETEYAALPLDARMEYLFSAVRQMLDLQKARRSS